MKELENKFHRALEEQAVQGQLACGLGCPQLMAQAQKLGGVRAVKEMIKRGKGSENFEKLQNAGKLVFSVEALVTKSEFGQLFTDQEVDFCLAALCDCGFYG